MTQPKEPWGEQLYELDVCWRALDYGDYGVIESFIRRTREEARAARDEDWRKAIKEIIENAAPYDGAKWHNDISVKQLKALLSKMEEEQK